jgi:hypothetical protein
MRKLLLPLVVAVLGVITFTAAPVVASNAKTLAAKVHHKHLHKKHKHVKTA